MNDQSRYIVDSRYFDGTCLTFMTDGFRSDFGGETLEEMRVRENNPYLTSVTRQRIDKMLHLYLQALSAPFSEISWFWDSMVTNPRLLMVILLLAVFIWQL